jgi:hypothetical protein
MTLQRMGIRQKQISFGNDKQRDKGNTEILERCSRMTIFTHRSQAWMGHPAGEKMRGFFAALRMTSENRKMPRVGWAV